MSRSFVSLSARDLTVAVDAHILLSGVELVVASSTRLGLVGPNGSGKSTLPRTLAGLHPPDHGRVTPSPAATTATSEARSALAKFGLGAEHVVRPLAPLSPGERTRATLATLQSRGVNLLVLDEPTNHLDMPAIEQLEQAVAAYEGTLVMVTHDRRFAGCRGLRTDHRGHQRHGPGTALTVFPATGGQASTRDRLA